MENMRKVAFPFGHQGGGGGGVVAYKRDQVRVGMSR